MAIKKPLKKAAPKAKSTAKAVASAKSLKKNLKPKAAKAIKKPAKAASTSKKTSLSLKAPLTRAQMIEHIAQAQGLAKKEVAGVFETIIDLMQAHLSKKGPGEMNFAGILKCRLIQKPATKSRQGTNPFTGKPMTIAAKPARLVIKIRPLKKLKEIVA